MKNRTIIGIICMVLAVAITFAVAPLVNRLTSDTVTVLRLSGDVSQGAEITEDHLESVTVKRDSLPDGILNDKAEIVGKYASSDLYAGDYLTAAKVSGDSNAAKDVFAALNGSKYAVSITIDTFAAGLSGKLENGDIISIIVVDNDTNDVTIPGALKYMKVITTTTAGGIEQDAVVKNEDGSYEVPSTITLLANAEQAKLLAKYEGDATMTAALVYRGSDENAKKFLDKQDEYFLYPTPDEAEPDEDGDETSGGKDIIQEANDIINGNADYFDVVDALGGDEVNGDE